MGAIKVTLNPEVERVIHAVLRDYEMGYEELIRPNKARGALEARHLICLLCQRILPNVPQSEVAWSLKRELNQLHAGIRRLERDMATQPSLAARLQRLLDQLTPAPQAAVGAP